MRHTLAALVLLLSASFASAEDRELWRYTVHVRGFGTLYMDSNVFEVSTGLSLTRKVCSRSGAVKYVWKDGRRLKLVAVFRGDKCAKLVLVHRSRGNTRTTDLWPRVTGVSYRRDCALGKAGAP